MEPRALGGLLAYRRGGCMMNVPVAQTDAGATPVLEISGITKHFAVRERALARRKALVYAVDGISFSIAAGETLGLVGESGCGKSTLGRAVLRLTEPTSGTIRLLGQDITHVPQEELRRLRRHMQIIFQDPFSSLNPRLSAGDIVGEPIGYHRTLSEADTRERVAALFDRVGLRPEQMEDFPSQFSGGQRQRIGIARALAAGPDLIVGDEPVSALDVSVQAQVINLLMDLQDEYRLSYLFIAHDLSVVQHISHRIAVMYLGKIVELAPKRTLFASPLHPYTEALLSAVPIPDPAARRKQRIILAGDLPSPIDPPPGCHFHTRCPHAFARCSTEVPMLREAEPGHWDSCHLRCVRVSRTTALRRAFWNVGDLVVHVVNLADEQPLELPIVFGRLLSGGDALGRCHAEVHVFLRVEVEFEALVIAWRFPEVRQAVVLEQAQQTQARPCSHVGEVDIQHVIVERPLVLGRDGSNVIGAADKH